MKITLSLLILCFLALGIKAESKIEETEIETGSNKDNFEESNHNLADSKENSQVPDVPRYWYPGVAAYYPQYYHPQYFYPQYYHPQYYYPQYSQAYVYSAYRPVYYGK